MLYRFSKYRSKIALALADSVFLLACWLTFNSQKQYALHLPYSTTVVCVPTITATSTMTIPTPPPPLHQNMVLQGSPCSYLPIVFHHLDSATATPTRFTEPTPPPP